MSKSNSIKSSNVLGDSSLFAQALRQAGIIDESGAVNPLIRRAKPNRRPRSERQKAKLEAVTQTT